MNLEQAMQAWINASLELATVMEREEITHISPVLRLASGKDGELSLRIFEPEGADEDWEMESFWEYEEEAA